MAAHESGDIVVNYEQVGALLKGSAVLSMLEETASGIRARCGSEYEHDTKKMGTRYIASVSTASTQSIQDNLDNNTLLKALS